VELTDEIRRAVWAEECQRLGGHDIDDSGAFLWSAAAGPGVQHLADNEEKIPHLVCRRCGRVWLVVPLEGLDYDDAERALYGLLQGDTELARRIVRHRSRREARRAERERGEGDPGAGDERDLRRRGDGHRE
jgi:hypothetical protein